ncbi:MAG TPA: hypothetical protein VE686_06675 [Beijerinckiaceae bacterium]|nr:hypothetical protein [Beijerinckiaceae bacterium]
MLPEVTSRSALAGRVAAKAAGDGADLVVAVGVVVVGLMTAAVNSMEGTSARAGPARENGLRRLIPFGGPHMSTRAIAIVALVIAVIVLIILLT